MGEIPAIETERLAKSFGSTQALSGLDLTVPRGGIRLLGPERGQDNGGPGAGHPVAVGLRAGRGTRADPCARLLTCATASA
jgi:hypothetical protein